MVDRLPLHRWILGVVSLLVVGVISGVFYVSAAPPQSGMLMPQSPLGTDPLTTSEHETISRLLPNLLPQEDRITSGTIETLLIERHQEEKGSGVSTRRGDVYLYDYSTDTLIHAVINVTTREIDTVSRVQGVQLPLTEAEVTRAVDIIVNSGSFYEELAQRYQEITGNEFVGMEQLQIKAFAFLADSMPDRVNSAAVGCGVNRCAQLLLYTQEHVAFEMMPIINLSTQQLVQTMAFGIYDAGSTGTGSTENSAGADPTETSGQSGSIYLPFVSQGGADAQ
ncbi:MAG: hypothetical protein AAF702_39055 [Chloroflexota bacterium]